MSDPRSRSISANEFQVQMPTANLFAWHLSSQAYTSANGGGSLITTDATTIGSLKDMSGNGWHLNPGNAPQYKVNQLGTYPGILFNGSNNFLKSATISLSYPYTIYIVFSAVLNGGAFAAFLDGGSSPPYLYSFTGGNPGGPGFTWYGEGGYQNGNTGNTGLTNFNLFGVSKTGSNLYTLGNNGYNPGIVASSTTLTVLCLGSYCTPSGYGNMVLLEMIVYSESHNFLTHPVPRYLNQKYGLGLIW
jgi:hypothetical protein